MATRTAKSQWNGTLKSGKGIMSFAGYEGPFTFASRFEDGKGTNPEELVGAAISGCFSMFLAALVSEEGLTPTSVETSATVELGDDNGPKITTITLETKAVIPGIAQEKFDELVAKSKTNCPVSRLYKGAEISVIATLQS
jgi:osmotically inducible protein OsmC